MVFTVLLAALAADLCDDIKSQTQETRVCTDPAFMFSRTDHKYYSLQLDSESHIAVVWPNNVVAGFDRPNASFVKETELRLVLSDSQLFIYALKPGVALLNDVQEKLSFGAANEAFLDFLKMLDEYERNSPAMQREGPAMPSLELANVLLDTREHLSLEFILQNPAELPDAGADPRASRLQHMKQLYSTLLSKVDSSKGTAGAPARQAELERMISADKEFVDKLTMNNFTIPNMLNHFVVSIVSYKDWAANEPKIDVAPAPAEKYEPVIVENGAIPSQKEKSKKKPTDKDGKAVEAPKESQKTNAIVADAEPASKDPANATPNQSPFTKTTILIILGVIIVILAIGAAAAVLTMRNKKLEASNAELVVNTKHGHVENSITGLA